MMKNIILTMAVAAFSTASLAQAPQLRTDNIDEILNAMTLREKATLLVGELAANQNAQGTQIGNTEKYIPGAAGNTHSIPRLGIPPTVMADGPAGLRIYTKRNYDSNTYNCTGFPIGTSLAASWNEDIVYRATKAMGNEVLEYGVDVLLAPGNNIQRNPLCGRNFEYFSEDPVLSGNIAAAYINGIQSNGVGTSLKHYAFNNQETRRLGNDARVSQRAAREIYLKPFEIAVKKSQPWTVMSSYNKVNGEYTNSRRDLLTDILRNDWGYNGIVVTDWGGYFDAVKCITAGNDLVEPGSPKFINEIVEAVENGKLDQKYVDACVRRMLAYVVKTPRFNKYKFSSNPNLKAHAQIVREAAAEGTVLLKNNENLLPLTHTKNVALFGCGSYRPIAGGTGSGDVNKAYIVSLVEGMRNAGFNVDNNLVSEYTKYLWAYDEKMAKLEWWQRNPVAPEFIPDALADAVKNNDIAIVTIQRQSGEGRDRPAADFELDADDKALLTQVADTFHKAGKKIVVVLNVGGAIETASMERYSRCYPVAMAVWTGNWIQHRRYADRQGSTVRTFAHDITREIK
ncbi:glycoside hydrolase family 3 protein [Bacteroides ovatus]|nr:glycoside hydrolase family 3 protein [Bacteroides ovatus]